MEPYLIGIEPCASARAGADVTHPMGFSETEPSIAAVVGSLDRFCSRYAAEVLLQGHRVEIIQARLRTLRPGFRLRMGKGAAAGPPAWRSSRRACAHLGWVGSTSRMVLWPCYGHRACSHGRAHLLLAVCSFKMGAQKK